jgi:hypothetical protein
MITSRLAADWKREWSLDIEGLTARHSSGVIVQFMIGPEGWSGRIAASPPTLSRNQLEKCAREAGQLFAEATGGEASDTPAILRIPRGWDSPVEQVAGKPYEFKLRPEFLAALAAENGVPAESIRIDMLLTGLMSWYTERRANGVPADPHMEAFVAADAEVRSGRVKLDFG